MIFTKKFDNIIYSVLNQNKISDKKFKKEGGYYMKKIITLFTKYQSIVYFAIAYGIFDFYIRWMNKIEGIGIARLISYKNPSALLFTFSWIIIISLLLFRNKNKKTLFLIIITSIVFSVLILANITFLKLWGIMFSLSSLGLSSEGSKYILGVLKIIPKSIIIFIILHSVFIFLGYKFLPKNTENTNALKFYGLIIFIVLQLIAYNLLGPSVSAGSWASFTNSKNI